MSTTSPVTIPGPTGQTLAAAPLGRRCGAAVMDGLLSLAVVYLPYLLLLGRTADLEALVVALLLASVLSLAWGIFVWWMHAQRGYTPGKRAFGLRTQSVETGAPAGWLWILVRGGVPGLLGALTLGAGALLFALSILLDPQRRGWHDKIARTVVVEDRPAPVRTGLSAPVATSSSGSRTTPSPPVVASTDSPTSEVLAQPRPLSSLAPEPVPTPVAPTPLSAWSDSAQTEAQPAAVDADRRPEHRPEPSSGHGLISAVPGFSTTPAQSLPSPAPTTQEDDEEHTVMRRPQTSSVVLRFDHGEQVQVNGRGLVGRNPAPGRDATSHLVRMPEDSFSVSKTHLEFLPEGAGVRVRDLHSTNGVSILDADGERPVIPGEWVSVSRGSTVRFGDHTFKVGA